MPVPETKDVGGTQLVRVDATKQYALRTKAGSLTDLFKISEAQNMLEKAETTPELRERLALVRYAAFQVLHERREPIRAGFSKLRMQNPAMEPRAYQVANDVAGGEHDFVIAAMKAHDENLERLSGPQVEAEQFRSGLLNHLGAASPKETLVSRSVERAVVEDYNFFEVEQTQTLASTEKVSVPPAPEEFSGRIVAEMTSGELQMLLIDVLGKKNDQERLKEIFQIVQSVCMRLKLNPDQYLQLAADLIQDIAEYVKKLRNFELPNPYFTRGNGYVYRGVAPEAVNLPQKTDSADVVETVRDWAINKRKQASGGGAAAMTQRTDIEVSDTGEERSGPFEGIVMVYRADGKLRQFAGKIGNGSRSTDLEQSLRGEFASKFPERRPRQVYALDANEVQNAFRYLGNNGAEQIRMKLKKDGMEDHDEVVTIAKNQAGEFIFVGDRPSRMRALTPEEEAAFAVAIAKDPVKHVDCEGMHVITDGYVPSLDHVHVPENAD